MVQKENRGGFRARIIVSAVEAVQRIIPQRMPERSGMGAYLMAGTTANTATRKGQPHAMKLRICVKGWQVELWAVKIIQGQKFRPARPARVALQHPAFVAFVCAQGPPDRKVFLKPPSQQGHIAFFAVPSHFKAAKVFRSFGAKCPANQAGGAVIKPLEQLRAGARR